jgi:hypothetical protein
VNFIPKASELQHIGNKSCNAGSGRSFTAYVFNRKGFVPPPLATCAAAAEEAAAEASLQPATPHDSRELPLIRRSSSEHTECAHRKIGTLSLNQHISTSLHSLLALVGGRR